MAHRAFYQLKSTLGHYWSVRKGHNSLIQHKFTLSFQIKHEINSWTNYLTCSLKNRELNEKLLWIKLTYEHIQPVTHWPLSFPPWLLEVWFEYNRKTNSIRRILKSKKHSQSLLPPKSIWSTQPRNSTKDTVKPINPPCNLTSSIGQDRLRCTAHTHIPHPEKYD